MFVSSPHKSLTVSVSFLFVFELRGSAFCVHPRLETCTPASCTVATCDVLTYCGVFRNLTHCIMCEHRFEASVAYLEQWGSREASESALLLF